MSKLQTKVLVTQPIHAEGMRVLNENIETVIVAENDKPETLLALLDDQVEGVVVRYNVFNREMIEKAKNLKVIARHGIGVELIDLTAATENGVIVVNTPDAATASVAEHVLAMAIILGRKMFVAHKALCQGNYAIKNSYGPDDVEGKMIGFIGLGRIGSAAAKRCLGVGMRVMAYDPYLPPQVAADMGITLCTTLEEVLQCADFVSLHTPLTPETEGMIGAEQLAMMKPTAYLINCSRGKVVDEPALIAALKAGQIAGAGLDVFAEEPPQPDNELLSMENVVVTPHSSSLTMNGKIKMAVGAAEQLVEVLRGGVPQYIVNKDVLK